MKEYFFTIDASATANSEEEARDQIAKNYDVCDDEIRFIEEGE